jgi:5S rRNA maturation endonuclease (ribonuclease M5)
MAWRSISVGDDHRVLIHCHAGCEYDAVIKTAGFSAADLSPERQNGERRIVSQYDYRDESGKLLYQSLRYEPKDFRQRAPDGNGGWNWSTAGIRRVLYRLPEIAAADPEQTVFVVEGEKDADRLAAGGILATTNVGGASKSTDKSKWLPEYSESLRGRRVVILADNDEPGDAHAESVARSLRGKAASVHRLDLPHLPPKGDVSDWLNNGGNVEALIELADAAPTWVPKQKASEPEPQPKAADEIASRWYDIDALLDGAFRLCSALRSIRLTRTSSPTCTPTMPGAMTRRPPTFRRWRASRHRA